MATVPPTGVPVLKAWTANFSTKLSAAPTSVGCTTSDATSYASLSSTFLAKAAICEDPATRTKVSDDELRLAKSALLAKARQLCKVINAYPGTTDPMRISFGLNPKDVVPTPFPVPTVRPELAVDAYGNVRIVPESAPVGRAAKPKGTPGAIVITAVLDAGQPAPTSPADGRYATLATTRRFTVPLPEGSGGKMLYVMAFYVNFRGEPGPVSAIVSTRIAA